MGLGCNVEKSKSHVKGSLFHRFHQLPYHPPPVPPDSAILAMRTEFTAAYTAPSELAQQCDAHMTGAQQRQCRDDDFSVCIVPRGGGPSAGARPPPYSPPSPSPLSIEPTCSRPACQDSHALHTTHRCHPCCSHLRFDDSVSPPAPATITTLCSVHLHHAQPCKPRKSPWSTPSDSSLHRQQRAFGSLLPSSTHLLLRHPLQIRHQKTRLGAGQPARSLPAAFGGQLLQGSVCN